MGQVDGTHFDRTFPLPVSAHVFRRHFEEFRLQLPLARQVFRLRHIGHLDLMLHAFFHHLKRGRHGEDRLAVLDRHHTSGGETAAIANPIDFVDDRNRRIARAHEIAVKGMHMPVFDHRSGGRYQRLPDNLTAEHPLPSDLWAATTKQVVLQRLQVENFKKCINGRVHRRDPC